MFHKRAAAKKKQDQMAVMILAGVFVGFSLLGLLAFSLQSSRVATNPETLCPLEQDYGHTVVLIDKTEAFTEGQRRFIKQQVKDIGDGLNLFEKLSIFVLDHQNFSTPVAAFSLCNPGDGSSANALYENPRKIRQIFDQKFGAPLDGILDQLAEVQTSPRSPIMEMIQEISFLDDFRPSEEKRRLILVSDMLQHMPGKFSQFAAYGRFADFKEISYARQVSANLDGFDVIVFYLLHGQFSKLQTRGHILFWEQFFQWTGATLTEVRPVR